MAVVRWVFMRSRGFGRTGALVVAGAAIGWFLPGCTGDVRVELAAADAIHEIAGSLAVSLEEYDRESEAMNEWRTRDVAMALAVRLRHASAAAEDADVQDFLAATARLRADYRAGVERFAAASDNVALLREIAEGLRHLAVNSMSLGDEGRRYFSTALSKVRETLTGWIQRKGFLPGASHD